MRLSEREIRVELPLGSYLHFGQLVSTLVPLPIQLPASANSLTIIARVCAILRIRCVSQGFYMQPTMITDFEDDWPVFKDEVFGPVLTVTKFKSIEEVVRRANDTPFGLAAGIFSRDTKTVSSAASPALISF